MDGALFGSINVYDNVTLPLREHTRRSETGIRRIVLEKLLVTGLSGTEKKLPGEVSGGMRKRAGLSRALVLDPEVVLRDEPVAEQFLDGRVRGPIGAGRDAPARPVR